MDEKERLEQEVDALFEKMNQLLHENASKEVIDEVRKSIVEKRTSLELLKIHNNEERRK